MYKEPFVKKLHMAELMKKSKKELSKYILQESILPEDHPKFNLTCVKYIGDIYTCIPYHNKKKPKCKWLIIHKVWHFGEGYEELQHMGIGKQHLIPDGEVVREPEDYNEYLKQFGL